MRSDHCYPARFILMMLAATTLPTYSRVQQAVVVTHQVTPGEARPAGALATEASVLGVDATVKTITPKPGELDAVFFFRLTNKSREPITILDIKSTCGCTVPKWAARPWVLQAGEATNLQLDLDLRGKSGLVIKTATIETNRGNRVVTMQVNLRGMAVTDRQREVNMQMALEDRQAIFKGECALCHVPSATLWGESLYAAACGICHEAVHRAEFVPDLNALPRHSDRDFWRAMIAAGKPGTLMPAFSSDRGGPLAKPQIDSLVEFLVTRVHSRIPAAVVSTASTEASVRD